MTLIIVAALLAAGASRADKAPPIHVILSSDTEIYARGLNGIQAVLNRRLRLHYFDALAESESEGARAFFRSIESRSKDNRLVITLGPRATRAALRFLKKVPVVFAMVSAPRTLGPVVRRHCGVSMDVPVSRYFRTLKEIAPKAKNVYVFYSTAQGKFVAGEGAYSDLGHGVYYHRVSVPNRAALPSVLKRIGRKADAIHIIPDPLYDRVRFNQVRDFSRTNGVVLMTSFAPLVRAGATFGLAPDYFRLGTLAGEMANRIISGRSECRREGVRYSDRIALYLNVPFARASGIAIPQAVRKRAALTRLTNAGIRLFNQKKLKSAKKVFEAILIRDPGNQAALAYRGRIISLQTGGATQRLMKQAERAKDARKYGLAVQYYRRVLEINPAHVNARNQLNETIRTKSEQELKAGLRASTAGRPFDAIRHLRQSVATLPTNQRARAELARLRQRHQGRVDGLYARGLQNYNRREYGAAIATLNQVLLLRPAHRGAREYLRLSVKKRGAIQRLLRRSQSR